MTDYRRPFLRDAPTRAQYLSLPELRLAAQDDAGAQGRLGDLLRCIRHPEAVPVLERAVDARSSVTNRIRLATARFYVGDHHAAENELRACRADATPERAHFATQHLGKCLAEQGRFAEATTCFEAARRARVDRNADPLLVESSRLAIEEAGRRANGESALSDGSLTASDWLQRWHDRTPGVTPRAFLHGTDERGESSYHRLARRAAGPRVLDVACGDGALLEILAGDSTLRVAGIDASEAELEAARRRLGTDVELKLGDVEALPFADDSFDSAVCHLALMLFSNLDRVLAELARTIHSGGTFAAIVGGPAQRTDGNAWSLLVEILHQFGFTDRIRLINMDAMRPDTISALLAEAGFRDVMVEHVPISFDATPADVWQHFTTSYDPQRMSPPDIDHLREEFLSRVAPTLAADGRVTMELDLQEIAARRL